MKICIDPGHNYSGWNTGACGNGLREQDVTFSVADRLRTLLENAGVTVVMTRTSRTQNLGTDNASSLKVRCDIANAAKADLFLSLHCNAGGGTGVETLVYTASSAAAGLGRAICDTVSGRLDLKNRGVKERPGLAVLRGTSMTSVLVEMGFLDHKSDAAKLQNQQEEYAKAIFEAISAFYGFKKENEMEEKTEFLDMNDHYSQWAVEKLAAYGVVGGYADKTFRPDQPVTRGEAAVMMANVLTVLGK